MKKTKFLLGALMLISTSVLTSCFSNDIPEIVINGGGGSGSTEDNVKINQDDIYKSNSYSYSIQSNISAHINVNGSLVVAGTSYSGKGGIGDEITITATPDVKGYGPATIEKKVKLDTNGKSIKIVFVKESVSIFDSFPYSISLQDAFDKTDETNAASFVSNPIVVKNAPANRYEAYSSTSTDLTMTVSHATVETAMKNLSGDKVLNVAAKGVAITEVKQNLENVDEWFPVMVIETQPDGAKFESNPVTVEVTNKYFEKAMNFRCVDPSDPTCKKDDDAVVNNQVSVLGDGKISMKFNHFSDHVIATEATVVLDNNATSTITTQTLIDCKIGNQAYNYFLYSGWKCDFAQQNEIIKNYLDAKFGPYSYAARGEVTISNLSARASVPITITQTVYTYHVYFGTIDLTVTVYGPEDKNSPFVDVDKAVTYDETRHSGGAAF